MIVYAPYISKTVGTYINNVKVWDCRWWMNMICKVNWFFHFGLRKRYRKWSKIKVPDGYCLMIGSSFGETQ